jgi:ESS family glutamate:Na+ symporter
MQLDPRQTIIVGILVLFLGKYLNRKISLFRRFNIPEPVVGGIVASVFFGILCLIFDFHILFSNHYRDILLVVFFTAIGLSTEFRSIIKGGRLLFLLTLLAIAFLFVQNLVGILTALLLNHNPNTGILAGSAALQGGHGTVVAWAPILGSQYGVANAMEIGMVTATFGLILGGILGGPAAKYLVQKHKLEPENDTEITIGTKHGTNLTVDFDSMLIVILMISLSIGLGIHLNTLLSRVGLTLPLFVTCMFGGVVLANVIPLIVPKLKCPTNSPTLAIVSDLSLGLFLAMALMALRFWEIGDQALFITISMVVQTLLVVSFSVFVVFRVLGRNYDSAVIAAGYIGSSLGATPTAMANMAAVTQRYGPSPVAFVVIPIVAAFIIQVSNALVIELILRLTN